MHSWTHYLPRFALPIATACLASTVAFAGNSLPSRRPTASSSARTTIKSHEEAGSVQVSIVSVTPWDTVKTSLQPNFALDEKGAMELAVPSTSVIELRSLELLSAALSLQLPTSLFKGSEVTESVTGKDPVTTSREETTDSSGNPPGASASLDGLTSGLAASSLAKDPLGIDPLLKLRIAKALLQEYRMVNQEVLNAATQGYDAYLVRLNLSLIPNRRELPYDAFAYLSFFCGDLNPSRALDTDLRSEFEGHKKKSDSGPDAYAELRKEGGIRLKGAITAALAEKDGKDSGSAGQTTVTLPEDNVSPVRVIPLVATDNIVAALGNRSEQRGRALAFALAGTIGNTGFSSDFKKRTLDALDSRGRDFNSTFLVGRVNDGSVVVRLGAQVNDGNQLEMVPQNHSVSVIVLYPKATEPQIVKDGNSQQQNVPDVMNVLLKSTFVHGVTGKTLNPRSPEDLQKRFLAQLSMYGFPELRRGDIKSESKRELENAMTAVLLATAMNDFERFKLAVDRGAELLYEKWRLKAPCGSSTACIPCSPPMYTRRPYEALWLDTLELVRTGKYAVASTKIFPPKPATIADAQNIVIASDGKRMTTSLVVGGTLAPSVRAAWLEVSTPPTRKRFAASAIEFDSKRRMLNLTFPGKVSTENMEEISGKVQLDLGQSPLSEHRWGIESFHVQEATPAKHEMHISQRALRTGADGKANLGIMVKPSGGDTFSLFVDGAHLSVADAKAQNLTPAAKPVGAWTYTKPKPSNEASGTQTPSESVVVLTLPLTELTPGVDVVVTLENGTPSTLRLPVLATAPQAAAK